MNGVQAGPSDALKSYRYLRIGILGAVLLLATSIVIERTKVDCWQTSISAYYYTPVRAIFVGSMIAVGFALIVIKGKGVEDVFLNFAGMLAPLVAVAPTTDVGRCWSTPPRPLPIEGSSVAPWVDANIDNNVMALLIAGGIGLIVALLIAAISKGSIKEVFTKVDPGTLWSLAATAAVLLLAWWLFQNWSVFDRRAHGFAAVGMFTFLICAVTTKAVQHKNDAPAGYFLPYAAVAFLMAVGGLVISLGRLGGEHTVFFLEAFEILLFAAFWLVQTTENWNENPG
jgi:hypothetical protein